MENTDIKTKLRKGIILEFTNTEDDGGDLLLVFYRKSLSGSKKYFIELNGSIIFDYQKFGSFMKKLSSIIWNRNLSITK